VAITDDESGFASLFNGTDLDGWFSIPRVYSPLWSGGPEVGSPTETSPGFSEEFLAGSLTEQARWSVEDGVIVGRQNEPGGPYGGFLLSERTYADFELRLEVNLSWPADSGVLVRKTPTTWKGIQILLDHRQSGNIGGYYGNGIGAFHAVAFNLDAVVDDAGDLVELFEEDPAGSIEPIGSKGELLTFGAPASTFLEAWNTGGWNDLWITVEGRLPKLTTRVNGVLISEIDLATLDAPHYDAEIVAADLGRSGHIALEVHDRDPYMGEARWGHESTCRWRNIRIKELAVAE